MGDYVWRIFASFLLTLLLAVTGVALGLFVYSLYMAVKESGTEISFGYVIAFCAAWWLVHTYARRYL